MSSKFDNVISTFFSDQLDQHLALYQNLLGLWHSYIDPQIIWTSPSLYWKRLFMNLWKRTRVIFELEIWQRIKYFFLRPARSTIIPLSEPTRTMTLLHRPSNYLNKSFTILKETFYEFMKTHESNFWARNLTTY